MRYQARLISLVLQHLEERSGYQVVASGKRLHIGTHLEVVLERPIILHEGRELIRSQRVRVYLSYHALIWSSGLPLRGVAIVGPELGLPATAASVGRICCRAPTALRFKPWRESFREFSGLVERVTIANARVDDATGRPLLEDFSLTAAPRRRHAEDLERRLPRPAYSYRAQWART